MMRWPAGLAVPALFALLLGPVSPVVAQSARPRTVLVVLPGSDDPGYAVTTAAIREALQARSDILVDYFREYLEIEHLNGDDAALGLRDSIKRKFQNRPIDVVIAHTTPLRDFVLRFREELFPGAVIVFQGMGDLDSAVHAKGITGIDTAAGLRDTLALALRLHPSTRRVVVLVRALDGRYLEMVRPFLDPFADRVQITYVVDRPVKTLLGELAALPSDALVFYIQYSADEPGTPLSQTRIAELIGAASAVPIYGVVDTQVGTGAVGGWMRTNRSLGLQLGTLALRILAGEPAERLGVQPADLVPVFDWRQLRRWHIDPGALPPRSEIRFREPTAWERYRWQIVATSLIVGVQFATIVGLLVQRTRRREAQQALLESQERLAQASRLTALGEFAASIAHEVRQPLTAIITSTRAALRFLRNGATEDAREALSYVLDAGKRADEVIERNRELFRAHTVHKARLDLNAVVVDALTMTRQEIDRRQVVTTTALAADLPVVHGDRLQLHQVLVNLIVNAVDAMAAAPAVPRRLAVETASAIDGVQVNVRDNGVGLSGVDTARLFELSYTTKPMGTGVGLSISRAIVEAHGGTIWASANPDGGATFSFTLPTDVVAARPHARPPDVAGVRIGT